MTWPANTTRDHLCDSDAAAGFEITDDFARFDQMNDMFTRAMWDDTVKSPHTDGFFASYRMEAAPRRGEGFSQRDFALRNAAWLVSDIISNRGADKGLREGFQGAIENDTPVAPMKADLGTAAKESQEIKRLARFFGADLCGITHIDPRWHYTHRPDTKAMKPVPNDLPDGLTHVIVMGHEMDKTLVDTYPSALAGAAAGREYSHEAAIVMQLAAYIRNLGFQAIASMNDTALVIPYAIKAGLGEYGRNQMVLTPEFGPRVRFSKIFTDMPLDIDVIHKLGLTTYCQDCTICADACPPKALPKDGPKVGSDSPSTLKGVKKWSANCEACFGYWAKIKTDCAICMRVCPFNHHSKGTLWYRIATSRFRKLAQWWAVRHKPDRMKPSTWWASR
ncbi:reductive dehalogenase [Octadecabacter sp. G9-8]|uniref:Reductive dehalogenase n=1 Tax=Octadecabacter dasysiphoniae TaxID=2909341 RepID=A0ABS9D028_9RHOB|nr:reductive dehalogenase domain-containing protein [Octadecabacter dasysiphoniae]MCF2872858.1 reductive dehalogenase [Octadecabacter dasysiphoniae]